MKVDLSELRALEQRATPAPWGLDTTLEPDGNCLTRAVMTTTTFVANVLLDDEDDAEAEANAALIVALRNAAPALLDAYAERDRLREALKAQAYLSSLYERLWKGGAVRDLAEAIAAVEHTRALLTDHSEEGR